MMARTLRATPYAAESDTATGEQAHRRAAYPQHRSLLKKQFDIMAL